MKFESQENVNNQTTTSEIENIENLKNTEIKQKCKKNLICKLAIITTSLISVTLIVILIIVFLTDKKNKGKKYKENPNLDKSNQDQPKNNESNNGQEKQDEIEEEQPDADEIIIPKNEQSNLIMGEEKNNSLIAVYKIEKGVESILFNPKKINLSENDYRIEILSIKEDDINSESLLNSSLRNLNDIDYKYYSNNNGKIEIKITFFIQLTTISELFKDRRNLIEIDLSNLDGSKLKDVNSVLENCENLVIANFTFKNGTMIESMDSCFSGCKNLKEVDLTDLEPKENVSINYMFKNCSKLNYVNLTKFRTNKFQGIFNGANNIIIKFKGESDYNPETNTIIEIIKILNKNKNKCKIGNGLKCKSCMDGAFSQYCSDCNKGYYLPYKKRRTECLRCEENCIECIGLIIVVIVINVKKDIILVMENAKN